MVSLSNTEKKIVLRVFKDITKVYNANTISKLVGVSRMGASKSLKRLEQKSILKSVRLGKAFFYRIAKEEAYAKKIVEILLMEEAMERQKWIDELKNLFPFADVLLLFGSILKDEIKARDIDILIVLKRENDRQISRDIGSKNEILLKKIHPVKQTMQDFRENLAKKDKVLMSAISEGIVLHGYEEYVEIVLDAGQKNQVVS